MSKALEPRGIAPESIQGVNQVEPNPAPIYTEVFGENPLEFSAKTREEIGRSFKKNFSAKRRPKITGEFSRRLVNLQRDFRRKSLHIFGENVRQNRQY